MTTIAVRDGVMAADSLAEWNDDFRATRQKVYRVGSDVLIGFAGNTLDALVFLDWYERGADRAALPEFRQYRGDHDAPNFEALVLSPGSLTFWGPHFQPLPMFEPFWAIGSGMGAALAAMHMGADAKKAVEIAKLVDVHTGGPVEHWALPGIRAA